MQSEEKGMKWSSFTGHSYHSNVLASMTSATASHIQQLHDVSQGKKMLHYARAHLSRTVY